VRRLATAGLWLGVGLAKMAALAMLIEGQGLRALLSLLLAFGLAALDLRLAVATH
jgi:hypothetical protein